MSTAEFSVIGSIILERLNILVGEVSSFCSRNSSRFNDDASIGSEKVRTIGCPGFILTVNELS